MTVSRYARLHREHAALLRHVHTLHELSRIRLDPDGLPLFPNDLQRWHELAEELQETQTIIQPALDAYVRKSALNDTDLK